MMVDQGAYNSGRTMDFDKAAVTIINPLLLLRGEMSVKGDYNRVSLIEWKIQPLR
ncbi:hypothetical protein D3C87_2024810 [compost metagenome]